MPVGTEIWDCRTPHELGFSRISHVTVTTSGGTRDLVCALAHIKFREDSLAGRKAPVRSLLSLHINRRRSPQWFDRTLSVILQSTQTTCQTLCDAATALPDPNRQGLQHAREACERASTDQAPTSGIGYRAGSHQSHETWNKSQQMSCRQGAALWRADRNWCSLQDAIFPRTALVLPWRLDVTMQSTKCNGGSEQCLKGTDTCSLDTTWETVS